MVRASSIAPPPYEGLEYEFAVENVDYPHTRFEHGPTSAEGPIVVRGYLSSDGVAHDGGPAGEQEIVPLGSSLAVGERLEGSFRARADLDSSHPFAILVVVPSDTQPDYDLGNNSQVVAIGAAPLSNLGQWLIEHPWIRHHLRWERPGGLIVDYDRWDDAMRNELQSHVNGIVAGTPVAVPDPPPLAIEPSGTEDAETTLTPDIARRIFLAQVARSIVSDQDLPWKTTQLNDAELTVLFDSRELFRWDATRLVYFRSWRDFGRATPGDPSFVYAFMHSKGLIGTTRRDTIYRVLEWTRRLIHYYADPDDSGGSGTASIFISHWQYAGDPPVSRVVAGTVRTGDGGSAPRNYTAGCWGTSALLALMLRTVNIPADFTTQDAVVGARGGHALPHFMHENFYLSHGDDPYNGVMKSGPWIPVIELPVPAPQFQVWFGPGTTGSERHANIGRRVCELDALYLSGSLVRQHCEDVAGGTSHETSGVYTRLQKCLSLEALESMDLWGRLDAKARELAYCTP